MADAKRDDDEPNWLVRHPIRALAALAGAGVAFLVGWGLVVVGAGEPFARGTFGDSFGPIAALFNGLAFAAAIVAIVIQRHELELQREEMRLSREEMQAQRAEMIEQRKAQTESAKQQKIANRLQTIHAHVQIAAYRRDDTFARSLLADTFGPDLDSELASIRRELGMPGSEEPAASPEP